MTEELRLTNKQIIDRVLTGDTNAFDLFIHRYTVNMSRYALTLLHDPHKAEEAVEEAFVECFLHLSSLNNPEAFEGWLAMTVKRKCFRLGKQRQNEDISDLAELLASNEETPEEYLIFSEEQQKVREAVGRLPEKLRETTVLYYFEDCPVSKISQKLGIPPGSVKRRLYDAREKLKKELCDMAEQNRNTNDLEKRIREKISALEAYYALNKKNSFKAELEEIRNLVEQLANPAQKKYYNAEALRLSMLGLSGEEWSKMYEKLKEAGEQNEHPESLADSLISASYGIFMGDDINLKRAAFLKEKALPRIEESKGLPGYENAKGRILLVLGHLYATSEKGDPDTALSCYREGRKLFSAGDFYAVAFDTAISAIENAKAFAAFPDMGFGGSAVRVVKDRRKCAVSDGADCLVGTWVEGQQAPRFLSLLTDSENMLFNEDHQTATEDCLYVQTVSEEETVSVKAGTFEHCHHFKMKPYEKAETDEAWYKEGIGIVKAIIRWENTAIPYELADYTIAGGEGLLPLAKGNAWTYTNPNSPEGLINYVKLSVKQTNEKEKSADLSEEILCNLPKNCLADPSMGNSDIYMTIATRLCEKWQLQDALTYLRAVIRANTNKELTSFALASVESLERFADYQSKNYRFLPSSMSLVRYVLEDGKVEEDDFLYSFGPYRYGWRGKYEDRIFGAKPSRYLSGFTGAVYNKEWKPGYHEKIRYIYYDRGEKRQKEETGFLDVEDGGTVETPAGRFENCLKVTLNAEVAGKDEDYYLNFNDGYTYQWCGKKEHWFAPDVGLVKMVCTWGNLVSSELLLTSYSVPGKGSGDYYPVYIGNKWTYEETHLKEEGYRAARVMQVVGGLGNTFEMAIAQEFVFLGTEEEYKEKFFPGQF